MEMNVFDKAEERIRELQNRSIETSLMETEYSRTVGQLQKV